VIRTTAILAFLAASPMVMLRHLGGLGLFLVAMLDSSPIPTFGGLDILTAVLSARHREPWFYYAAIATAGSVISAYMTFRAARGAGAEYLERRFGKSRVKKLLAQFEKWGTGALVASTAIPFPFPTSFFFAAAGVLKYSLPKFIAVVAVCRAARYATVAVVAALYGRKFIRALGHPDKYYGWAIGVLIVVGGAIGVWAMLRKHAQRTA
jgi:membrane protein YqaA with SNARE-associated domain